MRVFGALRRRFGTILGIALTDQRPSCSFKVEKGRRESLRELDVVYQDVLHMSLVEEDTVCA